MSVVDLVPLLQKTLKDESSVTCKMSCAAVRVSGIRWIPSTKRFCHQFGCYSNRAFVIWMMLCRDGALRLLTMLCMLQHCIMALCCSSFSELGLQLVINLLTLRDCSYWLVRTELLETLAEMDFRYRSRLSPSIAFSSCDPRQ